MSGSASDSVREYVASVYVQRARHSGETTLEINVGDVHRALGLHNRVPLVCAALKSKKFLEKNGLRLKFEKGPPSGLSTTVTFTYEVLQGRASDSGPSDPISHLRGVAKDVFKALGGGEAFVREERASFSGVSRPNPKDVAATKR